MEVRMRRLSICPRRPFGSVQQLLPVPT